MTYEIPARPVHNKRDGTVLYGSEPIGRLVREVDGWSPTWLNGDYLGTTHHRRQFDATFELVQAWKAVKLAQRRPDRLAPAAAPEAAVVPLTQRQVEFLEDLDASGSESYAAALAAGVRIVGLKLLVPPGDARGHLATAIGIRADLADEGSGDIGERSSILGLARKVAKVPGAEKAAPLQPADFLPSQEAVSAQVSQDLFQVVGELTYDADTDTLVRHCENADCGNPLTAADTDGICSYCAERDDLSPDADEIAAVLSLANEAAIPVATADPKDWSDLIENAWDLLDEDLFVAVEAQGRSGLAPYAGASDDEIRRLIASLRSQEPNTQKGNTLKLTLSIGHAEYNVRDIPGLTITDVWSLYANEDENWEDINEDNARERFQAATDIDPTTVARGLEIGDVDYTWENIVTWEGERDAFEAGLRALVDQINVQPSGDDDTFDYWPSGVRYAQAVAKFLGGEWPSIVTTVAEEIITDGGFDTFAAELFDKIGLEPPEATGFAAEWAEIARLQGLLSDLEAGLPVESGDVTNAADIARIALAAWAGYVERIQD